MQTLIFYLGGDRYGLPGACVRQVLPLLELKQLPGTPAFVAGLMNLHGEPVPVIDLCLLACGRPCAPHFSTRLIVVDYPVEDGACRPLGLIAERVTGTLRLTPEQFREPGVSMSAAPYLGKVAEDGGKLLQLVSPDQLLPEAVRQILFPDSHDHAP